MAEFGTGGTGKTWVAEAPAPLALAERIGVRRMQEQAAAERARIQLAKQKQTQQALDDAARNKAMEGGGFDAGLYAAPFAEYQQRKMKELQSQNLPTPELIRKAGQLKTDLQNTAFKYKNASEAANKQISALPTEFYDPAQVQAQLQNEIQKQYPSGTDLFADTPQAEDMVQKGAKSFRNIRGGNIGNKVAGMIESNITEQGSKNAMGGGFDIKTQIPLGFKKDATGALVPDAKTFNQLFMSQTAGPEFVTSFETEAINDPNNPFTQIKTGLDKQLASGIITQDAYNDAMENNRFAHVVVPNLGGLSGLSTRFPQVSSVDKFAAQLTEDAKKRLEYRKPPQESTFVFNVPGTWAASFNAPQYTVTVPPQEQEANKVVSIGSARVYQPTTGKFRNLTTAEMKDFAGNKGLSDNKIDLVPEIRLRGKMDFKAVDKNGNLVKLDYNPKEGETFDPVLLAKSFAKAGGQKLVAKNFTFNTLDDFLMDRRRVAIEPLFKVRANYTNPNPFIKGTIPTPALFFNAKTKPELLRRWNDYSTKPLDEIMKEWQTLPIKALDQYRGNTGNQY